MWSRHIAWNSLIKCFQIDFNFTLRDWDIKLEDLKGRGFYDKLGSDIGTKNPKKSALTAFIDRSGWFLAWRLNFSRTTPKIGDCGAWSASFAVAINKAMLRFRGGGDGLGGLNAAIANFRCNSASKIVPLYQKSAQSINKCGESRLYRMFGIYIGS